VAVAARELEKIALYLHPETLIPPEAVTVCSGRNRSVTPWEIQDLLLERQLPPILEKLQAIVDSGESPFSVLMATQRFLSSLMTIKFRLAQSQADEKELALSLRMPERAVRQLITHHRRFSSAELRAAFHELARLDDRLKSSRLRGDLLLHDFFCRWIPPGPYAPRSP
jgi:DNA polymerase III delta subunit